MVILTQLPLVSVSVAAVVLFHATVLAGDSPEDEWTLVFEEQFHEELYKQRWRLEGSAELTPRYDRGSTYLEVQTQRHDGFDESVLWCTRRFEGDLRITFRARGQQGNRAILYFNANPTPASQFKSIFDQVRPDAEMWRYAGDDNFMTYSVGMLRNDQDDCNLRFIGGPLAEAYREIIMNRQIPYRRTKFGAESIIKSYACSYTPETWFDFDLRVEGRTIRLLVDGQELLNTHDPGNVGTHAYGWTPLVAGGWIGFRNFNATRIDLANFRVFKKSSHQAGK